jgi:5-methylcytosine-specific restriction endonuclease McrA
MRAYMITRAYQHAIPCGVCGRPLRPGKRLHLDHIVSRRYGGTDTLDNVRVTHSTCNLKRGAGQPPVWPIHR